MLKYILLLFLLANVSFGQAQDSLYLLDQAVILSNKDGSLQAIPSGISILDHNKLNQNRVLEMRDLSNQTPNLHIPDYGSKITSALYIRGVGARVGNSAIGLYVDNAPFLDKSGYDFDLFDIKRIEILRGPQGTLYGRNSMGGQINIYTISPWDFQGMRAKISSGSYGLAQAQVGYYGKINTKLRFNVGLNLRASDGYQQNQNTNHQSYLNWGSFVHPNSYHKQTVGATQSAGLRMGLELKPNNYWHITYKGNYEYSDQNGYAYGKYNSDTHLVDTINYNDLNFYRRNLINQSLKINHISTHFTLSYVAAYQNLNDEMNLDQDFTPASIFTLRQKQRLNTVSNELVLRSNNTQRIESLVGISGFYLNLNTSAPVVFKSDGVKNILQAEFDQQHLANPRAPKMTILNKELDFPGNFTETAYGSAFFTQAKLLNLGIKGLSFTAGIRVEHEQSKLDYLAQAGMKLMVTMPNLPSRIYEGDTLMNSQLKQSYTQLLPKIALQYEWNKQHIFASIAKGYKAGGYNIQMFSEISQSALKSLFNTRAPKGTPVEEAIIYKPEQSWNFELGSRFLFFNKRLSTSFNLFYLQLLDQQIVDFAPNGQGRIIKNAGKSHSQGIEFSAQAQLTTHLQANLAYGFTDNVFDQYIVHKKEGTPIDYAGNKTPYAPRHTLSIGVDYTLNFNQAFIDQLVIGTQLSGAGKIYWTERNDVYQDFYQLLNTRVGVEKNGFQLAIWGRNLTNKQYNSFYFESFNSNFGQLGRPVTFGVDLMMIF